jgi:DNA (cytosine-5)-methyltransferase 1
MRHGSLFSGIGGFDLAAEWMGWENVFHCEWNKFGQQILKYYWPKAISYEDITKTDFTIHRGSIDIITGGFPCQPYSSAGKRLGKKDERHLWPEMLRAIREIQPSWVVGENVRGLTNWNGGLVFDEVQVELETQGYEVLPFLLPACAVNAPHRRDRIWFVAHSNGSKQTNNRGRNIKKEREVRRNEKGNVFGELSCDGFIAYTNDNGNKTRKRIQGEGRMDLEWFILEKRKRNKEANGFVVNNNDANVTNTNVIGLRRESDWIGEPGLISKESEGNYWQNFPTVSPICNGDDGISNRLDNITFPKWRQESIKAGGNAIVPQVVHQIFKSIEEYESLINSNLTAETAVKP